MIDAGDSQESPSNTIRLSDHESIIEEGRIELMFQIDLKSRKAIYEQVIDHFAQCRMLHGIQSDHNTPLFSPRFGDVALQYFFYLGGFMPICALL